MAGAMFEEHSTRISKSILDNDMVELKAALNEGEDPFYKDRKGNTYLHYVCTMHRPFIIHIVIASGIDLNARNRHGNTALHVTALQNECFHVGDVLAAGIDATIKNRDGKTAAEIPTHNIFWKTIYDKYQPGIFEAIASHDVDKVLYLLHCWSRVDTVRDGQTLRQYAASRKFHDLVFHIDVHRHSLGAIYSVLEGDPEKAWTFLSHSKCDVNYLNFAAESSHILQHAIKLRDIRLVRMICKSKVNVNLRVTVHGYLKAPVFFVAIDPNVPENIMWAVLKAGADFTLKDERGRNAAIYALDKCNRKIACDVIVFMMKNGLDVSQRDMTGVTLRDVARFARRRDILTVIDKAFVKTIRTSNLKELERLSVMGYDSLLIDFNHRDTFIYASGNETEDVLKFTEGIPNFFLQVRKFHYRVHHSSLDEVKDLLTTSARPDLLINARDKGGRVAIHLCVLHWRFDVLRMLLSQPDIDVNAADNLGRTVYHYACAVEEEDERKEFCSILEAAGVDTEILDVRNHKASYNINRSHANAWISKERKSYYGMEKHLACVDKYEELCRMMKFKGKTLKHFNKAVCRFKHPVPQFASILSPLMPEYQDLLFMAMEKDKESIAVKLIQLGADWKRKEPCQVVTESDGQVKYDMMLMSVTDRAKQLGMIKVLTAIEKKEEYWKQINKEKRERNDNSQEGKSSRPQKQGRIESVRQMKGGGCDSDECMVDENGDVFFLEEVVEYDSEENDDESYQQSMKSENESSDNRQSDDDEDDDDANYSVDSFYSNDEDDVDLP